jgi:hypothetical protein
MVVDKCSTETKSQAILMAFVTLLTYVFDVFDDRDTNQAATYLMSTPRRDEDCVPFMLNECGCLNTMPKLQFMQSRRAKICILS